MKLSTKTLLQFSHFKQQFQTYFIDMGSHFTVDLDCVKSIRIRTFSGPSFPAFGLNMKKYSVSLRIQSEYGKIRTRKFPNTDTFLAVFIKAPIKSNSPIVLHSDVHAERISQIIRDHLHCTKNEVFH